MQVAQHGIRAILPGSHQQQDAKEDISGGDATWKAWKLAECHIAQVRVCVCVCVCVRVRVLCMYACW
jgi:hypothetical protein